MGKKLESNISEIMAVVFGVILISITLIVVATLPFYLLWNWLMPLFGLPNLTIVQSIGFLGLLNIIIFPYTYKNNK